MSESDTGEGARLRAKLAGLDLLREDLDPATYAAQRQGLTTRLAALVETGGGALVGGDLSIAGGDFTGRDQSLTQGGRSVALGRGAEHPIVITGDGNRVELAAAEAAPAVLLTAYYRDLAAECSRLPLGVVDPRFAQPGARTEVERKLKAVYKIPHQ